MSLRSVFNVDEASEIAGSIFFYLLAVVMAATVAIGVVSASMALMSDGAITHCYIERRSYEQVQPVYTVYGFIPWRSNTQISVHDTPEAAHAFMTSINCPGSP